MHKEIKENPKNEKIYNSLVIFERELNDSVLSRVWNKIYCSENDGFFVSSSTDESKRKLLVRRKNPHNEENLGIMTDKPFLEYGGVKFSYDICSDYEYDDGSSVSNQLLGNNSADFNILIAAGKPIKDLNNTFDSIDKKSAYNVIRCDKFSLEQEGCCSFRCRENVYTMTAMNDTKIQYADFIVKIEGSNKEIKQIN